MMRRSNITTAILSGCLVEALGILTVFGIAGLVGCALHWAGGFAR